MKENFERYRKEIKEYLKKNDPEIKQEFKYGSHLTDNPKLVDAVIEACDAEGNKTLLVAPCGAGKTYSFCCEIAKREEGKRQVILLVPNRIQAEQNAVYGYEDADGNSGNVIPVTGGTGEDFQYDCKQAISAVYDSAHRMLNADPEDLAKTVLVIDEAHQMISARSYRLACIRILEDVIERVIQCGGSVIYMTGTERKIRAFYYDRMITCEPELGTGILADYVELCRNKSHRVNMKEHTYNYIVARSNAGYIPMVRINNKSAIEILATKLRAKGLTVCTLSSNDKGYYIDADTKERVYDSDVYRSIMEDSVLPEADVYLTTSILEVGTSITGIADDDGIVSQPVNLLPTYVCLRPDDFDLDDIKQFFARPRFKYEKSAILMTMPRKSHTDDEFKLSYENVLLQMYASAAERCTAYNCTEARRSEYINMEGNSEVQCLMMGTGGNLVIDVPAVIAGSYGEYFRQSYMQADETAGTVGTELSTKVIESFEDRESADRMEAEGKPVPDGLQEGLRKAIQHPYFRKAVTQAKGIDGSNAEIKALRKEYPEAFQLIKDIRCLMVSDAIKPDEAVDIAIRQTEDPTYQKVDPDSGKIISFQEVARCGVYKRMATWKHEKVLRLVNTWKSLHAKESDRNFKAQSYSTVLTDDGELFAFNAVAETKKMEYLVKAFSWTLETRKWKDLCGFFAEHDERDCASYLRVLECIELNRLDPGTREYKKRVMAGETAMGAEYHAIRCPEKFFTGNGVRNTKDLMFPKGMIGKTITYEMMLAMAKQMPRIVKQQCRHIQRNYQYSAVDIERMLKSVYKCKTANTKEGHAIIVRGLRKNVRGAVSSEIAVG